MRESGLTIVVLDHLVEQSMVNHPKWLKKIKKGKQEFLGYKSDFLSHAKAYAVEKVPEDWQSSKLFGAYVADVARKLFNEKPNIAEYFQVEGASKKLFALYFSPAFLELLERFFHALPSIDFSGVSSAKNLNEALGEFAVFSVMFDTSSTSALHDLSPQIEQIRENLQRDLITYKTRLRINIAIGEQENRRFFLEEIRESSEDGQ